MTYKIYAVDPGSDAKILWWEGHDPKIAGQRLDEFAAEWGEQKSFELHDPIGCFAGHKAADNINHPAHYNQHPSGVECIDIAEHYGFNVGNCIKYLWRAGLKGDAVEDLKKARWYLDREISKREKE